VLNTLFGSVTARLIREGRMPAIVVPANAAFRAPKRILFAYSFDPDTDPHTLRPLNLLAAQFGAYVRVLTFFKEDKTPATVAVMQESATQKKLDGLLEGLRHGYRLEAGPDDLPGGILEQATHYQADLVAVIPHHHGFFENLFNRSVTQEMVARTQTPLLVLPEKRLEG
jgi:nucleotide-binding universal stress UspA family protein